MPNIPEGYTKVGENRYVKTDSLGRVSAEIVVTGGSYTQTEYIYRGNYPSSAERKVRRQTTYDPSGAMTVQREYVYSVGDNPIPVDTIVRRGTQQGVVEETFPTQTRGDETSSLRFHQPAQVEETQRRRQEAVAVAQGQALYEVTYKDRVYPTSSPGFEPSEYKADLAAFKTRREEGASAPQPGPSAAMMGLGALGSQFVPGSLSTRAQTAGSDAAGVVKAAGLGSAGLLRGIVVTPQKQPQTKQVMARYTAEDVVEIQKRVREKGVKSIGDAKYPAVFKPTFVSEEDIKSPRIVTTTRTEEGIKRAVPATRYVFDYARENQGSVVLAMAGGGLYSIGRAAIGARIAKGALTAPTVARYAKASVGVFEGVAVTTYAAGAGYNIYKAENKGKAIAGEAVTVAGFAAGMKFASRTSVVQNLQTKSFVYTEAAKLPKGSPARQEMIVKAADVRVRTVSKIAGQSDVGRGEMPGGFIREKVATAGTVSTYYKVGRVDFGKVTYKFDAGRVSVFDPGTGRVASRSGFALTSDKGVKFFAGEGAGVIESAELARVSAGTRTTTLTGFEGRMAENFASKTFKRGAEVGYTDAGLRVSGRPEPKAPKEYAEFDTVVRGQTAVQTQERGYKVTSMTKTKVSADIAGERSAGFAVSKEGARGFETPKGIVELGKGQTRGFVLPEQPVLPEPMKLPKLPKLPKIKGKRAQAELRIETRPRVRERPKTGRKGSTTGNDLLEKARIVARSEALQRMRPRVRSIPGIKTPQKTRTRSALGVADALKPSGALRSGVIQPTKITGRARPTTTTQPKITQIQRPRLRVIGGQTPKITEGGRTITPPFLKVPGVPKTPGGFPLPFGGPRGGLGRKRGRGLGRGRSYRYAPTVFSSAAGIVEKLSKKQQKAEQLTGLGVRPRLKK